MIGLRTKIVGTVGPASNSKAVMRKMIECGLSVFRLNFSHADYATHAKSIKNIHELNTELGTHISILADLQGPKIRVGKLPDDGKTLTEGEIITFTANRSETDKIYISYQSFAKDVKIGDSLLFDDGKLMAKVVESDGLHEVKAEVIIGGVLFSNKGVNLPDTKIHMPSLTEKDRKDLAFILTQDIHWLALSFVRCAKDVLELRELVECSERENKPCIMAKIEKPEALNEIDDIIAASDGIMIARGDLGVEIPFQQVPMVQKHIIKRCAIQSRPIIVATQMMEGMLDNIRPTRAEVNDVANSALDGADALMLSGETSVGRYPVESVAAMRRIIQDVEKYGDIYYKHRKPTAKSGGRFVSENLSYMVCELAKSTEAAAIITFTHSGFSAKATAAHRPKAPIFVNSRSAFILCQLNLIWGICGFYHSGYSPTITEALEDTFLWAKEEDLVKKDDLVVSIQATPMHKVHFSNSIKVSTIE